MHNPDSTHLLAPEAEILARFMRDGLDSCAAGNPTAGAKAFRAALSIDAHCIDAWYNLGKALKEGGEPGEAAQCYEEVIRRNPSDVDALLNLGIILQEEERTEEAIEVYQTALQAAPERADISMNLGIALFALGRRVEATSCFEAAARTCPDHRILHCLALAFYQSGKPEAAFQTYERILTLFPGDVDAVAGCAQIAFDRRDFPHAVELYKRVLDRAPAFPGVRHNLGLALESLWLLEEAEHVLQEECARCSSSAPALNALANVLRKRGRFEEAIVAYQDALVLLPGSHDILNNLGLAYYEQGRSADAIYFFREAMIADNNQPATHLNLAFALLAAGEWKEGWEEFEWRLAANPLKAEFTLRGNRLEPTMEVAGRTILVCTEQGFGDALQCVRYLPLLHARGARVVLACAPSLVDLLKRTGGIDEVVAFGTPIPPHDYTVPMMSLPRFFGTRLDTIPSATPYLSADPTLVRYWRSCLASRTACLRVGIAWGGSTTNALDRTRSLPESVLMPVLSVPGVLFVNLQKGRDAQFLQSSTKGDVWFDPAPTLHTFHDTAALVDSLDLIISADTAVAHLAGGLNKEVWTLLPYATDWRWHAKLKDSPWYPRMTLFRQPRPWDWESVITAITFALRSRVGDA